jgi:hypothetical protein
VLLPQNNGVVLQVELEPVFAIQVIQNLQYVEILGPIESKQNDVKNKLFLPK